MKQSTTLSEEEKIKISDIMSIDYMSTEESASGSENDDDENVFIVRPLPWLSMEAKEVIASLDRKAGRCRSTLAVKMMTTRKVGAPSTRSCPPGPEWAIDNERNS